MHRKIVVGLVLGLLVGAAAAQEAGREVTRQAFSFGRELQGRERVLYIVRQVEFTEKQRAEILDTLFSIYDPQDGWAYTFEQIRGIASEMEEAQAAGDAERVRELNMEVRSLGQRDLQMRFEAFISNAEKILNDEQRKTLARAVELQAQNPEGNLRTAEIRFAAEQVGLNDEQKQRLDQFMREFKQRVARISPDQVDHRYSQALRLVRDIEQMLEPAQRSAFAFELRRRRPELVAREGIDAADPNIPPMLRRPEPTPLERAPGMRPRQRTVPSLDQDGPATQPATRPAAGG